MDYILLKKHEIERFNTTYHISFFQYKYFNQKNINIPDIKNKCDPGLWIYGNNEYTNVMIGFETKSNGYDMIYKPTYKFK